MNLKLLGAFIVALLVVLGLPLLGGVLNGGAGGTAAPPAKAQTQAPRPAATPEPAPAATPVAQQTLPPVDYSAPMLDANSLIGTAWLVSHQMGQIEVQLYGGGHAVAKHQLIGELRGQWRVEGSNVVVTAAIGNRTETIRVQIRGTSLYYDGVEITRTR